MSTERVIYIFIDLFIGVLFIAMYKRSSTHCASVPCVFFIVRCQLDVYTQTAAAPVFRISLGHIVEANKKRKTWQIVVWRHHFC